VKCRVTPRQGVWGIGAGDLDPEAFVDRSVLDSYLAGVDPATAPLVMALDSAIRKESPGLDVAVKYKILMYTVRKDWRTWVCAIDARPKSVCLRFLYGVLLDDPLRVLRAGSSILMTWDFAIGATIDEAAVRSYVAEALAKHEGYKANSAAVIEKAKTAAKSRGQARP
jgi:hypothetical protein